MFIKLKFSNWSENHKKYANEIKQIGSIKFTIVLYMYMNLIKYTVNDSHIYSFVNTSSNT